MTNGNASAAPKKRAPADKKHNRKAAATSEDTEPVPARKRSGASKRSHSDGKREERQRHPDPDQNQAQPAAGSKVAFVWNPEDDPKIVVRMVLAPGDKANAFRLRSKDDSGLLVDQLRNLGHKDGFNIAAWTSLSRQVNDLLSGEPAKEELRNWRRVRVQLDKLANRAAHRRRKVVTSKPSKGDDTGDESATTRNKTTGLAGNNNPKQAGFKRRLRVSDAFAEFAARSGAPWQKGEFHSRSNCGTLIHRHIRLNSLRHKDEDQKVARIKVDEVLAMIVPKEDIDANGCIPAAQIQPILTRHCGHTISEPTSCVGDLPAEDDSPLPPGFTKPQSAPTESVTHTQLARVSQSFAEKIIRGQPGLDDPYWEPNRLHSRKTCAQLLERYCFWKDLQLPVGVDERGKALAWFRLDATITALFQEVQLELPAGATEFSRKDIIRLVNRHVTGDPPLLTTLCPPIAGRVDIEQIKIPSLAKPAPATADEPEPEQDATDQAKPMQEDGAE